jgi:methanesulfonate monooxygenase large subunit
MPRTAAEWATPPKWPSTHFVDSRLYTDERLFREEQTKIFRSTWIVACHESEVARDYDYRTFRHPAGQNLVIVRGDDGTVRAFYNVCPHRGNLVVYDPAGNARALTCIFHAWTFDSRGNCTGISRRKEGYQDRLQACDVGLRSVRCEVGYGGFVWVNLDDDAPALSAFIGEALGAVEPYLREPLEVFHYQRVVLRTNFKLWHDTNSEFYHDYMHYFNRVTGMRQPGYFERKYEPFPNGHASVGSMHVKYDSYAGSSARTIGWPGLAAGGWLLVDIFPGMTFNLRTSVLRVDTSIPMGPNELVIELRGLGMKSDSAEDREARIRDHNAIWGPFGRNLHEDLLGVQGQGAAMREPVGEPHWVLHGREEGMTIHDEVGMRHYYAEWGKRMGRAPSDPFDERGASKSAAP